MTTPGEVPDNPQENRAPLRFSPVVELGHILQAVIFVVTIGGWAIVGYLTIEQQIGAAQAEARLLTQRIDTIERTTTEARETQRSFAAEMRVTLDRISGQIADLRTLVAARR